MKLTAKSNMSGELVTVGWAEGLDAAYLKMRKNKIRHLPVLDDKGELVGLISDRDLQRAMHSEIYDDDEYHSESLEFDPESTIRDYMSWPVKTVGGDVTIREVTRKMIEQKISSFVVTDDDDQLVGIITTEDLLKVLLKLMEDTPESLRMRIDDVITSPLFGRVTNLIREAGI